MAAFSVVLLITLVRNVRLIEAFECDDGCVIDNFYVDDYFCDCVGCEDESVWNCTTCGDGCPDYCGGYEFCGWPPMFNCSNGCSIPMFLTNDSYCHCSDCEDESMFDCITCADGCPPSWGCNYYTKCAYNLTYNSNATFMCDDGCTIAMRFVDDSYCDCSNCDDESFYDCERVFTGVLTIATHV